MSYFGQILPGAKDLRQRKSGYGGFLKVVLLLFKEALSRHFLQRSSGKDVQNW